LTLAIDDINIDYYATLAIIDIIALRHLADIMRYLAIIAIISCITPFSYITIIIDYYLLLLILMIRHYFIIIISLLFRYY
jgi:hypothetical protein